MDDDPSPFRAIYWRHGSKEDYDCDTLDEALSFLRVNEDAGDISMESIIDASGAVVLEGEALSDAVFAALKGEAQP